MLDPVPPAAHRRSRPRLVSGLFRVPSTGPLAFLVGVLVVVLALSLSGDALAQEGGQARDETASGTVRDIGAGDRVEVRLVTVPFYAVDEDGEPVFDLEAGDLRVSVEGVALEPSFLEARRLGPRSEASGAPANPVVEPRRVLLFFDLAFSSPAGLAVARRAASGWLDELGEADRVTLLVHHSEQGLVREMGPVPVTAEARDQLRQRIEALEPDVGRLRRSQSAGLVAAGDPSGGRGARIGAPASQLGWRFDAVDAVGAEEYRAVALDLADHLERLAAEMRLVPGPKLMLFFSQGVDSTLYFEGLEGLGYGSTGATVIGSTRFFPIRDHFEESLAALAASGVLPVFVNGAGPGGTRAAGRSTLEHMGRQTGGLVVADGSSRFVRERLGAATAAYYEVGVTVDAERLGAAVTEERLEVTVEPTRPGVEIWSAGWLDGRRGLASLSRAEREALVLDLVRGGSERPWTAAEGLELVDLDGRLKTLEHEGRRYLQFAPRLADADVDELEVYSVVLGSEALDRSPELLSFERIDLEPGAANGASDGADASGVVRTVVPADGAWLWGVVALEPATGALHLRRLTIAPAARAAAEPRPASAGEAPPGFGMPGFGIGVATR